MPKPTLYLSYPYRSSVDLTPYKNMAELAVDVHNRLEAYGLDVFYDKESGVGEWQKILRQQLILREYFIVLLAPETLWEAQGVRAEVSWALAEGKTIIPLRVTGFAITQEIVPPEFAGVFKYYAIPLDPNNLDDAIAQIAKSLGVHVESKQPAKQNRIARFLSSQSWQGISAIIGIIGVIIAVIALNASNQSTANTTSTPQPSAVAVILSATSAPTDLPTSTPSHTPTDTPTPEITATTQPTTTLTPSFSITVPANVNIRLGPSYDYPILMNISEQTRFPVVGWATTDDLWYQIEIEPDKLGWIVNSVSTLIQNGEAVVASQVNSVVERIPRATPIPMPTPPAECSLLPKQFNPFVLLRSEPSMGSDRLDRLEDFVWYRVILPPVEGKDNPSEIWYQTIVDDKTGWVASWLVSLSPNCPNI